MTQIIKICADLIIIIDYQINDICVYPSNLCHLRAKKTIKMEILYLIIGIVIGVIFAYLFFSLLKKSKTVSKQEFDNLNLKFNETVNSAKLNEERVNAILVVNKELTEKIATKENTILELTSQVSKLNANNIFLTEKLNTQKTEFEELQKTAHLQFEKIANKLFEEKSSKFVETNKVNIETLLNPLKEDISKFKTKVEETYDKESKQRFSLEEKVKDLIEQTNKVSTEANNLATALKGKPQKRGNWGEMILERILETSELKKDREYFIQQSQKDEEGNIYRPDVKVVLPGGRIIFIDSKVSLIAYDKYVASEDPAEQKVFLNEHIRATTEHINQLSAKKYDDFDGSLDFTIMFIPIEPAYLAAIQGDSDLWTYAYSKRIVLVSPTTLIALLRMIYDFWRVENQSKNNQEIAKRGEALYEKFVGFTSTFEDIGNSIKASQDKYDKALGQFKEGKGNLVSQALQLKNLGLKSDKRFSGNMLPEEEED